jgi:hypothetical protein
LIDPRANYRIVKKTFGDGTILFYVEKTSTMNPHNWYEVAARSTVEECKLYIDRLIVIKEEVIPYDQA